MMRQIRREIEAQRKAGIQPITLLVICVMAFVAAFLAVSWLDHHVF